MYVCSVKDGPPVFFLRISLYAKTAMPRTWTASDMMKSVSWSSMTKYSSVRNCEVGRGAKGGERKGGSWWIKDVFAGSPARMHLCRGTSSPFDSVL
jgi:hypothetical protein